MPGARPRGTDWRAIRRLARDMRGGGTPSITDSPAAGRFRTGVRVGLGVSVAVLAAGPAAGRLARSWSSRAAVAGLSMAPLLLPGDWLLVDPEGYRRRAPRQGELVVVPDPRDEDRLLVKRVAAVTDDGRLELAGDDPDSSTDSRTFGPADPASVIGRPWARYWPPRRVGLIR
jgi:nickel-type superoxide dismutase maturation protease